MLQFNATSVYCKQDFQWTGERFDLKKICQLKGCTYHARKLMQKFLGQRLEEWSTDKMQLAVTRATHSFLKKTALQCFFCVSKCFRDVGA